MPQFSPDALLAKVEGISSEVGAKALVTFSSHKRHREMWCAAKFGIAYGRFIADCQIDIAEEDEQSAFDFYLLTNQERLPFQLAEVLDSGRKRGDEYKKLSVEQIRAYEAERVARSQRYAIELVRNAVRDKLEKYVRPDDLHLLLYLNFRARSVSWASLSAAIEPEGHQFRSVWVIAEHCFACLYGGTRWHGENRWRLTGARQPSARAER